MKRAFLFAGQGQQFLHMGQDLAEAYPVVSKMYQTAEKISGIDILNLDEASLNQTRNTQLALYVLECAISELLKDIAVDVVAGLSLGEYAALTKAGVIDFETGVTLIQKRGAIMDSAFESGTTGMVALLKTNIEAVEAALSESGVEVCNYNTESQIVIGGKQSDIEVLMPQLKDAGIRMAIPLKVSSVSHMSLLLPASNELRVVLDTIEFKQPTLDFIGNVSADYQTEGFAQSLQQQISQRTRMYETITRMIQDGVEEFIEIGPKGSISKFVAASDKSLKTFCIYDLESLLAYQERN